jgi:hypothetical protein
MKKKSVVLLLYGEKDKQSPNCYEKNLIVINNIFIALQLDSGSYTVVAHSQHAVLTKRDYWLRELEMLRYSYMTYY